MYSVLNTKKLLITGLLATTIMACGVANSALAEQKRAELSSKIEQQATQQQHDKSAEKRQEIVTEARVALRETENALRALDEGNVKEALKALEKATGKLEVVLTREPSLQLAMVNAYATTNDVYTSIDTVKKIREQAEEALEDGRIQEARYLLKDLASETVIKAVNIPLGTYPAAIKTAISFIDDGKINIAKQVLQTALNTLVVTEEIIPIPVTNARLLLAEAETLAEQENRSEDDNTKLKHLLDAAKAELEFAEALGYGTRQDFKNLYAELEKISDKTKGGKFASGLFEKIKSYLADTTRNSQPKDGKQHIGQ